MPKTTPAKPDVTQIDPRTVPLGAIVMTKGTQTQAIVTGVSIVLVLSNGEQNVYVAGAETVPQVTVPEDGYADAVAAIDAAKNLDKMPAPPLVEPITPTTKS